MGEGVATLWDYFLFIFFSGVFGVVKVWDYGFGLRVGTRGCIDSVFLISLTHV